MSEPTSPFVVLGLSPQAASHLAVALRSHRQWAARSGLRVPSELTDLQAMLTARAREGQRGSEPDDAAAPLNAEAMDPKLVTYDDAARLMSVSRSTLKRLIRDGALAPVRVGGVARLRVADVDAYVAGLAGARQPAIESAALAGSVAR